MRRCKHSMGLLKCLLVFSPLVRTRMSSCWLIICSPVGAAGIFNFALTLVQFNKNVYVFNIALPSGQAVKCMHKRLKRLKLFITAGIVVQSQLLLFIIYICFIKQRIGNKIWSKRMKSTGKHLRLKRSSKPREDSRYLGVLDLPVAPQLLVPASKPTLTPPADRTQQGTGVACLLALWKCQNMFFKKYQGQKPKSLEFRKTQG